MKVIGGTMERTLKIDIYDNYILYNKNNRTSNCVLTHSQFLEVEEL